MSWVAVSPRTPNQASSPALGANRRAVVIGLPALVALAYALGHLNWYLGTPLGRVPVLDEHENLYLAAQIYGGHLPHEPLYRAPGYALLLAGARAAGVPASGLFAAALLIGALLHSIGAGLVASISDRWFGIGAGVLAGMLFALDPVLVHYATQALDSTFSMTLFLAGLAFLSAAVKVPGRTGFWAGAGMCWAAATLVRPNYLLVWLALPVLALFQPLAAAARVRMAAVALASALLFVASAAWQRSATGTAAFLPWQGAYNLWASNRPGANGRYYSQRVSLPPELARLNPARAESIILYSEETNGGPTDIASMNTHWRQRFTDEVSAHPLAWARLMAKKAYALLNNWEQYNNKTYAFHKALSPWLRWNPLCWGVLLILGVAGGARLLAENPRAGAALAVVTAACTASIILFFVSARFRLPLVGINAALAGGALASPRFWQNWAPGRKAALAACAALAALLAFSNFGNVSDPATFVQDHVLLARAAYTVGDDEMALAEARAALQLQPRHPDALAIERAASAPMPPKGSTP